MNRKGDEPQVLCDSFLLEEAFLLIHFIAVLFLMLKKTLIQLLRQLAASPWMLGWSGQTDTDKFFICELPCGGKFPRSLVETVRELHSMYELEQTSVLSFQVSQCSSLYSSPQGPRSRWQGTCCPTPQNVQWQSLGPQKPSSSVLNRSV